MDAKGRLLIGLSPFDSWSNPLGILATDTGRVTRVAGESLSDHHSGVWTPDGRILSAQVSMRHHLEIPAGRKVVSLTGRKVQISMI